MKLFGKDGHTKPWQLVSKDTKQREATGGTNTFKHIMRQTKKLISILFFRNKMTKRFLFRITFH